MLFLLGQRLGPGFWAVIYHGSPSVGAVDAESGFGHELQTGQGNRVAAANADTEIGLVYFRQGVVQ